jgi:dipeptidase E
MRLLLGSGGFNTPERQAGWKRELDRFLGPVKSVLFVPYALADHDAYVQKVIERGFHADREIVGIHRTPDPRKAVEEASAIYVGGGNSFRLLHDLYKHDLLDIVRQRVRSGKLIYVGVSAGTNMACPTLKTTNDMPIVMPPSFEAFGLIPFQINPHYFAGPIHFQSQAGLIPYAGETRDDRIREFHEMNSVPVLGLWEGSILRIEGDRGTLAGEGGARLFRLGESPRDFAPGAEIAPSSF